MLSVFEVDHFIQKGYVCLPQAFSPALAAECREILWRDMGCDPQNPTTWTRPVVWLWAYSQAPFVQVANGPALMEAYDQLVGPERWVPMRSLGTFPVRFPAAEDTQDTGWHVDASFPGPDTEPNDFLSWRVNVHSQGRALLALFLFSDVGELDAPTRIRAGSHREMARVLAPAGEAGIEVRALDISASDHCPEVRAVGPAGTVYLCHPFLVHAAQINRGHAPRFLAQPPLYPKVPFDIHHPQFPVETAIQQALR